MARSRTLQVVIAGDATSLERAFKGAGRSADTLGRDLDRSSKRSSAALSGIGSAARSAGLALGAGLAVEGKRAVSAFLESEKVARQTEAVIKSTGGAARVSAKDVASLASAISLKTGIDDEAIATGQNLLLTFTNVRNEVGRGNDVFNQATRVVTDMSVALDQDLKASSIQVGKALNDPIKGITALSRVGVTFTDQQKEQIRTLTESGRKVDAQRIILAELRKEFGGSAEAQADAMDKAKVAVENLEESIGSALAPTVLKAAEGLSEFVTEIQTGEGAGGDFARTLRTIKDVAEDVFAFPGAKQATATLLGIGAAAKLVRFTGIDTGLRLLGRSLRGVVGIANRAFGRAGASAGSQLASSAASTAGDSIGGDMRRQQRRFTSATGTVTRTAGRAGGSAAASSVAGSMAGAMPGQMRSRQGAITSSVRTTTQAAGRTAGAAAATSTAATMASTFPGQLTSRKASFANAVKGVFRGVGAAAGIALGIEFAVNLVREVENHNGPQATRRQGRATLEFARAGGGRIPGAAVAADTYPALLSPQEFVVTGGGERILEQLTGVPGVLDWLEGVQPRHFAAGGSVGPKGVYKLARSVLPTSARATLATAVSLAENRTGNPRAVNRSNSDGSIDEGLWQINSVHRLGGMLDAERNARAMDRISKDGSDFSPWSTYKAGLHRQFMGIAQKAASAFGRGTAPTPGRGADAVESGRWVTQAAGRAPALRPLAGVELDRGRMVQSSLSGAFGRGFEIGRGGGLGLGSELVGEASEAMAIQFKRLQERVWRPGGSGGVGGAGRRGGAGAAREGSGRNWQQKKLGAMVAAANAISGRYPYIWGGGHPSGGRAPDAGVPGRHPKDWPGASASTVGFDCSGAVGRILRAGGYPIGAQHSSVYSTFGEAGPGKYVTVYGGQGHTMMELNVPRRGWRRFGTSGSNPRGGAAWFGGRGGAGSAVVARHPPGMAGGGRIARLATGGAVAPGPRSIATQALGLGRLASGKNVHAERALKALADMADDVQRVTYGQVVRTAASVRKQVRVLMKGGLTSRERVQVERLRGTLSVLDAEMGRRVGALAGAVDQQGARFERAEGALERGLRIEGIDPGAPEGLARRRALLEGRTPGLTSAVGTLRTALLRARRARDKQSARDLQERLGAARVAVEENRAALAELGRQEVALLPTQADRIDAWSAEAALTPGEEDDRAAAQAMHDLRSFELQGARAGGDVRQVAEAARALKAAADQLEGFNEAAKAIAEAQERAAEAQREHTAALVESNKQQKRQNDIASHVMSISAREAIRGYADVISGHIAGPMGFGGRSMTAGDGVTRATYGTARA